MFNGKKGGIMRHPYLTLTVLGLATVGVISISDRIRCIFNSKPKCVENMLSMMKKDEEN